jgi:hypothetical protein
MAHPLLRQAELARAKIEPLNTITRDDEIRHARHIFHDEPIAGRLPHHAAEVPEELDPLTSRNGTAKL